MSEGGGVLSHLGRVDGTITHCTILNEDGSGEFGAGTMTFMAANGDTLLMEHSGTFQMVDLGADVEGTWTVDHGTGRFDGATGDGTFTAFSDFVAGTTSAEYHGMIHYDASNRAG